MSNTDLRFARPGTIWVCTACGKIQPYDRYGLDNRGSYGWDESCMMNAVLCYEEQWPGEAGFMQWHAVEELGDEHES